MVPIPICSVLPSSINSATFLPMVIRFHHFGTIIFFHQFGRMKYHFGKTVGMYHTIAVCGHAGFTSAIIFWNCPLQTGQYQYLTQGCNTREHLVAIIVPGIRSNMRRRNKVGNITQETGIKISTSFGHCPSYRVIKQWINMERILVLRFWHFPFAFNRNGNNLHSSACRFLSPVHWSR